MRAGRNMLGAIALLGGLLQAACGTEPADAIGQNDSALTRRTATSSCATQAGTC